jgi:hypothetical protein
MTGIRLQEAIPLSVEGPLRQGRLAEATSSVRTTHGRLDEPPYQVNPTGGDSIQTALKAGSLIIKNALAGALRNGYPIPQRLPAKAMFSVTPGRGGRASQAPH